MSWFLAFVHGIYVQIPKCFLPWPWCKWPSFIDFNPPCFSPWPCLCLEYHLYITIFFIFPSPLLNPYSPYFPSHYIHNKPFYLLHPQPYLFVTYDSFHPLYLHPSLPFYFPHNPPTPFTSSYLVPLHSPIYGFFRILAILIFDNSPLPTYPSALNTSLWY